VRPVPVRRRARERGGAELADVRGDYSGTKRRARQLRGVCPDMEPDDEEMGLLLLPEDSQLSG